MKKNTKFLAQSAMIAAIYGAITIATSFMSFKSLQLRVAESMIMLTAFTPAAIPGLAIGCFLSNMTSPFGIVDTIAGAVVTCVAGICGYFTRKVKLLKIPVVVPVANILLNAFYVGFLESYVGGNGQMFWIGFTQVAISEAVVCYVLGIPLYFIIKKYKKNMDI